MARQIVWAIFLGALAATASADIKINDYLTLSGYASASAVYADNNVGKNASSLYDSGSDLNFTKIALTGTYGTFGAMVSLLYAPDRVAGRDAGILDAYVDWTKDNFTVTAGKFTSYLGYEPFDTNQLAQLTYGANSFAFPLYHTGAKVDYAAKTWGAGVAVVDSLYPSAGFYQGDGSYSNGTGEEAYFTYTGVKGLTLWAGAGEEQNNKITTDFWASYAVNGNLTLVGEVDAQQSVGKGWLAEAQYAFTPKWSAVFRVSGEVADDKAAGAGTNFTFSPSCKVTQNLCIRGEITYADAAVATAGDYGLLTSRGMFYGVQALFTF